MSDELFPKLRVNQDSDANRSGLLLDYTVLEQAAARLATDYRTNQPFPHIVIDDFLPPDTLGKLLADYPQQQDLPGWNNATHKDKQTGEYVQKDKRNLRDVLGMPASYRQLVWELNSAPFLDFLSRLTGIDKLIPDPNLRGAGIHQIGRGGFLKVHADFTIHRDFALDRRLNFLLYLNQDWPEEYGGQLELWDKEMLGPPRRVLPIANRCVVFSTTANSYHGHPHPLTCPEGVYRKSLALYYYTNGRPEGEAEPVVATLWQELPDAYR